MSTTILNACTKQVWKLIKCTSYLSIYLSLRIYLSVCLSESVHIYLSIYLLNFQVSTTILNACTKQVWKLIKCTSYLSIYLSLRIYLSVCLSEFVHIYLSTEFSRVYDNFKCLYKTSLETYWMQTIQTGEFHCSRTNVLLLTSEFGSSTRGERQFLKVFRNHTMLTTPQNVRHISWCFRSQFIFAGRDLQNLTAAATVENSIQWQRTQFSAPMAEAQLSAYMVQCQPSTPWSDP